jgi:DNA-directed RNA polymerase subunit RPC12/RpoP
MGEKSFEFKLCPSCGSTEFIEDYPTPGVSICEECGHEVTSVVLKVIPEAEEDALYSKSTCPFCGAESPEDDENVLFSENEDSILGGGIIVFKCRACGKLDGYRVLPCTFDIDDGVNEENFNLKTVAIAKAEGQSIYSGSASKKIVKALKEKEKNPEEICRKLFQRIAKEKSPKMLGLGVDPATIDLATWRVRIYADFNGPFSEKQLECLFSAEIALAQDEMLDKGEFKGKKITERVMEEIFDVDRKTIRKWKNLLKQPSS